MSFNTYIIIVTYNATPWLDKCLGSIDFSKFKVVVIDNNSKDQTVNHIEKNFPEVILFKEEKNLGFGKANNKGINYALEQGAEYFFLLNQDAWVEPETLETLCEVASLNPDYGILSPIHFSGTNNALDYNFSNYIIPSKCKDLYSDIYFQNYSKTVYELPFVNAAAWLMTKKCVNTVGGFSPSFFHYAEDKNYCQRVAYHKLKIGVVPTSKICHDREQSTENKYYEDPYILQKQIATLELSNPFYKMSKFRFFLWSLKTIVRLVINKEFNLRKSISIFKKIYKEIDLETLINNRELSKNKGATFFSQ